MSPSSTATTIVSGATTLAALAGAAAITIAYGWEAPVPAIGTAPKAEVRHVLAAASAPTMRDDCDPRLDSPYIRTAPAAVRTASGGETEESAAGRHLHTNPSCGSGEIGSRHTQRRVEGLGSGWIISADGVMSTNPYSMSDRHTIIVRPADVASEFKGRVIGLDPMSGPDTSPAAHGARLVPNRPHIFASHSPLDRSLSVSSAPRTLRKTT